MARRAGMKQAKSAMAQSRLALVLAHQFDGSARHFSVHRPISQGCGSAKS
jgi:hypothetical protein